jgi:ubiquinone/menaquinone biosynthesis C-methylase UbiE
MSDNNKREGRRSIRERYLHLMATQFGHPRGVLGQLIGHVMLARGNASINRWIVQLLDIQPSDHLLEIGCGPGVAIQGFAALAKEGRVVGIDASTVMVEQARKRNAKAIAMGRVEIEQGEASALPYPDASFEKVAATHVIYFWSDVVTTLQEVRRVLRPGGIVAIGFQIKEHMPSVAQQGFAQTDATLYSQTEEVEALLAASGFTHIHVEMQQAESGPAGFCALGQAPNIFSP